MQERSTQEAPGYDVQLPRGVMSLLLLVGMIASLTTVAFMGMGIGGDANRIGYGRIIAATEIVCLALIAIQGRALAVLSRLSWIVLTWLGWVSLLAALRFVLEPNVVRLQALVEILYAPTLWVTFYVMAKSRLWRLKSVSKAFQLLLIICLAGFLLAARAQEARLGRGVMGVNSVYYPLLILPWVLIEDKRWVRYFLLCTLEAAVLVSLKRAAIVVFGGAMGAYLLVSARGRVSLKRLVATALTIFLLGFGGYVVVRLSPQLGEDVWRRISNTADDRGSGRVEIYKATFRLLASNTPEQWMFGHGHNGVLHSGNVGTVNWEQGYVPVSAHDDWLEVLFDYGVIALALYAAVYLELIRRMVLLIRKGSEWAPAMGASLVMFASLSLVSHLVIYPVYFGYLMAFWGGLEGEEDGSYASGAEGRLRV